MNTIIRPNAAVTAPAAVREAAATLSLAVDAFRADPARVEPMKAAEALLIDAMRGAGLGAAVVAGRLYVDVHARQVADEDGDGLWDIAVIPIDAVAL